MTTSNAELAYQVLDHIDAHPELWDQGRWIGHEECGTVACFAGWTSILSGGPTDDEHLIVDGEEMHISDFAQERLGVTDEMLTEHGDLFCGLNSRKDLGRLVAEIFGPRPGGTA